MDLISVSVTPRPSKQSLKVFPNWSQRDSDLTSESNWDYALDSGTYTEANDKLILLLIPIRFKLIIKIKLLLSVDVKRIKKKHPNSTLKPVQIVCSLDIKLFRCWVGIRSAPVWKDLKVKCFMDAYFRGSKKLLWAGIKEATDSWKILSVLLETD